jgi:hypothetical protein
MTQAQLLHRGKLVDTGHWQGVTTEDRPDLQTVELLDVQWSCPIPHTSVHLREQIKPNFPWADDHFAERVSRDPSNPGEQYKNWPWWRGQKSVTNAVIQGLTPTERESARVEDFKFTHTYQERYWPKQAGSIGKPYGIRYDYGDLDDLVTLLLRRPYTRQAWLPIFFPEDTGAVHQGRVPCTLGYQFMLRDHQLHMWYVIRSCDYIRHFRDDLYLSARQLLWVLDELRFRQDSEPEPFDHREYTGHEGKGFWDDVVPGEFHFHCFSLHFHRGDEHLLERR